MENKQQTLEEDAGRYTESTADNDPVRILAFIEGAKWQQERMYSEEDIKYLEWIYERMINVHNENLNYDYMIIFKNILEQFKKKVNGKN